MDATHKTTCYELPLFVLCVSTIVGYVNVASFLLADEKWESIKAGLRQISQWNPDRHPKHFMSDFHEGQILALQLIFPG